MKLDPSHPLFEQYPPATLARFIFFHEGNKGDVFGRIFDAEQPRVDGREVVVDLVSTLRVSSNSYYRTAELPNCRNLSQESLDEEVDVQVDGRRSSLEITASPSSCTSSSYDACRTRASRAPSNSGAKAPYRDA